MSELTIHLEAGELDRLRKLAEQCGRSPEELARENLRKWLADERAEFLSAANVILKKNAELYRRLS